MANIELCFCIFQNDLKTLFVLGSPFTIFRNVQIGNFVTHLFSYSALRNISHFLIMSLWQLGEIIIEVLKINNKEIRKNWRYFFTSGPILSFYPFIQLILGFDCHSFGQTLCMAGLFLCDIITCQANLFRLWWFYPFHSEEKDI